MGGFRKHKGDKKSRNYGIIMEEDNEDNEDNEDDDGYREYKNPYK